MWRLPMFPNVNALPRAERYVAFADGNGKINSGECSANVGGHVVVAFGGMNEHMIAVGNEPGEEGFEVAANVGISVFLDEQ